MECAQFFLCMYGEVRMVCEVVYGEPVVFEFAVDFLFELGMLLFTGFEVHCVLVCIAGCVVW